MSKNLSSSFYLHYATFFYIIISVHTFIHVHTRSHTFVHSFTHTFTHVDTRSHVHTMLKRSHFCLSSHRHVHLFIRLHTFSMLYIDLCSMTLYWEHCNVKEHNSLPYGNSQKISGICSCKKRRHIAEIKRQSEHGALPVVIPDVAMKNTFPQSVWRHVKA